MRDLEPETTNLSAFVRPEIADMKAYTPIVPFDVLSQRLGREPAEIVKLDANENPYGPSPRAVAALLEEPYFHIYPDPESNRLRKALARFTGIPAARLLCGMGADELIDLVLRVLLSPGDAVIDCPPTFGMYPFSTSVNGGRTVSVPRAGDFSLNADAIGSAIRAEPHARVLFVCSPNNPDGSIVTDETLRALLELPVVVVLDEAYVEFAGQSRMSWTMAHNNLVVLRTFSKLAGLAGLRVGYGAFPDWLLPHLWKIKQPYNVNVAATAMALASLDDDDWLQDKVRRIVDERDRLFARLLAFEWLRPYPSRANFILCRVVGRDAAAIKKRLEQSGILVRYFAKPGLEDCIRISTGLPEQSERLITALTTIDSEV